MERKKPEPHEFYRHFKNKLYQVIAVHNIQKPGKNL